MQRLPWLRRFAVLMILGLLAAACGGDEPDVADTETQTETETETETTTETETETEGQAGGANVDGTLKLGTLLPLTGALDDFGPGMQFAVEMAVNDINEAGGVLGQDIQLVTEDSGTNAQVASDAVNRLLTQENVDGIIGAASSDITKAVIDQIITAPVAECSPSNTGPDFTTYEDEDPGFYFRTAPSDALQGQVLGNLILEDGFTEIAILHLDQAYGQGLANATQETIEAGNGSVVENVPYPADLPQGPDQYVSEIAQSNPQAIVMISYTGDAQTLLPRMIEEGIGPQDIPIYTADGLRSDQLPEDVGADLDGMKGTSPDFSAQSEAFASAFEENAPENALNTFAPQSYDCAVIMALAAGIAGTDDPSAFMQEVVQLTKEGEECGTPQECLDLINNGTTDIDYNGASGALSFAPPGEPAAGVYDIWQFTDGDVEVLRQERVE